MTWKDIVRRMLGIWPEQVSRWGPDAVAAFCAELERRDCTPEVVMLALDKEAGAFPPSAGQLADSCGAGTYCTPVEAWMLVETAIRKFGCSVYSDRFAVQHQAAVDWIAERDPAVAFWAAQRGLMGPGSLGHEPVEGEMGGAVRHRLDLEYKAVVQQVRDRVTVSKPLTAGELTVRSVPREGGMDEVVEALRPAPQIGEGNGTG